MKGWSFLLISLFLSDSAHALLKTGVDKVGGVRLQVGGILNSLLKVFSSPYVLLGVACYGIGFVLWLRVLGNQEFLKVMMYSKVHYVFILLLSVFYFRETITPLRGVGVFVILLGVAIFAMGEPSVEAVRPGQ